VGYLQKREIGFSTVGEYENVIAKRLLAYSNGESIVDLKGRSRVIVLMVVTRRGVPEEDMALTF
jgi:hypothetical protein